MRSKAFELLQQLNSDPHYHKYVLLCKVYISLCQITKSAEVDYYKVFCSGDFRIIIPANFSKQTSEYLDEVTQRYSFTERDGYIKYDGTGLKGEVAAWARAAVGAVVAFERLDAADEGAVLERLRAAETDVLVYAVGFEPTAPPDVFADEARVDLPAKAARDGALVDGAIYGAGLAYPEVWTDPEGHSEPRVGFVTHYLRHLGTIFANAGPPPGPREAKRRRRGGRPGENN